MREIHYHLFNGWHSRLEDRFDPVLTGYIRTYHYVSPVINVFQAKMVFCGCFFALFQTSTTCFECSFLFIHISYPISYDTDFILQVYFQEFTVTFLLKIVISTSMKGQLLQRLATTADTMILVIESRSYHRLRIQSLIIESRDAYYIWKR